MAWPANSDSAPVSFLHGQVWFWTLTVLLVSLMVAAIFYIERLNTLNFRHEQRSEVLNDLTLTRAHLEGNFASNLHTVKGLVAAISLNPEMSQAEFAQYGRFFISGQNQIRNIGGAPDMVIRYMYPLAGNEAALGLNYLDNPAQRDAVVRARDAGDIVIAGPVDLVQGGQGFIGRIPVFTDRGGRQRFWGLVSAVIDVKKFYQASGLLDQHPHLDIAIRGQDGLGSKGQVFFGDPKVFRLDPVITTVTLPNGSWQLAAVPVSGWAGSPPAVTSTRLIMIVIALLILIPSLASIRFAQKTRANAALLEGLFDHSPVGIALTEYPSGRILRVNPALTRSTGRSAAALLNLRLEELYAPTTQEQGTAPASAHHDAMEPVETAFVGIDGQSFPVAVRSLLTSDERGRSLLWSIVEDISERKKAEAAIADYHADLTRQMALLQTITTAQAEFIGTSDLTSAFELLLAKVLELTESEFGLIGEIVMDDKGAPRIKAHATRGGPWDEKQLQYYFCEHDHLSASSPVDAMLHTAIKTLEPVLSNSPLTDPWAAGDKRPADVRSFLAMPIVRDNQGIAILGIGNSRSGVLGAQVAWLNPLNQTIGQIVSSIRILRERDRAETAMRQAKDQAEAAAQARSQFLTVVSDEFRSPLNGLMGMLNQLRRSPLSTKQDGQLKVMQQNAESLLQIINDIVDYSKIESGKLTLDYHDFDIRTVIDDVISVFLPQVLEKQLDFSVDLSGIDQTMAKGDPHRIAQVLFNLIANAVKFTEHGGIHVIGNTFEHDNQTHLSISVSDTGTGIAPELLPGLFTPFGQIQSSAHRHSGGTGLGLAICKSLCSLMGGEVNVESRRQAGSCFSFTVRLVRSRLPDRLGEHCDLTGTDVVVVSDNRLQAEALHNQMSALGATCVSAIGAASLGEALSHLHGRERRKLVFIDTDCDVHAALEKLALDEVWAEAKLIALDAGRHDEPSASTQGKWAGICQKPLRTNNLVKVLRALPDTRITAAAVPRQPPRVTAGSPLASRGALLLVEDNGVNREVAMMMLEDLGLTVEVASDGFEAMAKLKSLHDGQYCCILMDCQMPGMDGFETTRLIRLGKAGPQVADLPIIALTANAMVEDERKCLAAGMNAYLAKPIDELKLKTALLQWVH